MAPETRRSSMVSASISFPSMRPGQDGPGNWSAWTTVVESAAAFNEAGARWPRKHAALAEADALMDAAFNEAGARWPRKRP